MSSRATPLVALPLLLTACFPVVDTDSRWNSPSPPPGNVTVDFPRQGQLVPSRSFQLTGSCEAGSTIWVSQPPGSGSSASAPCLSGRFSLPVALNGGGGPRWLSVNVSSRDGHTSYGTGLGFHFLDKLSTFSQLRFPTALPREQIKKVGIGNTGIYLLTEGGLVRPSWPLDGSTFFRTWTASEGLPSNNVTDFYSFNNVWAVGTDRGLAISSDSGTSFAPSPQIGNRMINGLAGEPFGGEVRLYVATSNGFFVSLDSGRSFTEYGTGAPISTVVASAGKVIAARASGVLVSTDNGQTFNSSSLPATVTSVQYDPVAGNFYAATLTSGILYAPATSPTAWTALGGAASINNLRQLVADTPHLAGVTGTDYHGNPWGGGWNTFTAASSIFRLLVTPAGGGSHHSFLGTNTGLYLSLFDAAFTSSPKSIADGLPSNTVRDLAVNASDLLIATDSGFSVASYDPWNVRLTYHSPLPVALSWPITSILGAENILYVASAGGGLAVSSDSGQSFTRHYTTSEGLPTNTVLSLSVSGPPADPDLLCVGTDQGLMIQKKGLPASVASLGSIAINDVICRNNLVFAATIAGLAVSTDFGASFSYRTISNGLPTNDVRRLAFNGTSLYVGTQAGLVRSDDMAGTWSAFTFTPGIAMVPIRSLHLDGSNVYAGLDTGLKISRDGGASFPVTRTVANGLPSSYVRAIQTDGSNLYLATGDGNTGGLAVSVDGGNTFHGKTSQDGLGTVNIDALGVLPGRVYLGGANGLYTH